MDPRLKKKRQAGILLVECLIYVTALMVIMVLAISAFNHMAVRSAELQRNAADIERALKAGERWRADVRAAVSTPRFAAKDDLVDFVIPQRLGEVIYRADGTNVHRRTPENQWQVALAGVKASRIEQEIREHVAGWKWEIELTQRQKVARVRPLFTFMAVAGAPR